MESLTYKEFQDYKEKQLGYKIPLATIQSAVKRKIVDLDPEHRYPRRIIINNRAIFYKPLRKVTKEKQPESEYYNVNEYKNHIMVQKK